MHLTYLHYLKKIWAGRLELPRPKSLDPKSRASTKFRHAHIFSSLPFSFKKKNIKFSEHKTTKLKIINITHIKFCIFNYLIPLFNKSDN